MQDTVTILRSEYELLKKQSKIDIELLEQLPHLANFMTPEFKQDWLEGNYSDNDSLPPDEFILEAKRRANNILDPNGEDTY